MNKEEKQIAPTGKAKKSPSSRTSAAKRTVQKKSPDLDKLYCANCGQKLSKSDKFCAACGTKVPSSRKTKAKTEKEAIPSAQPTPSEPPMSETEQNEVPAQVEESIKPADAAIEQSNKKKRQQKEQVDYEALLMANMPTRVRQRKPFATLALAGVSVLVAIVMLCATGSFNPDPEVYVRAGAEYRPLILDGQLWRLVTGTFLHFGFQHLLFNMLCLLVLGRFLEKVAGHANLLCVYLLTACTGGLLSIAFHGRDVCAGASGAVFGVFGASISLVALLWRKYNIDPKHMWGYMKNGLAFVGINFIYSLFPGVDMAGHIGGLLGGLAVGAVVAVPLLMDGKPFAKWFQRGFWSVSAILAAILACTTAYGVKASGFGGGSSSSSSSSSSGTSAGLTVDQLPKIRKAAEGGDAKAQYQLAERYFLGEGVPKDLAESARWMHKAADQGYVEAQNDLGAFYENGTGVEKNHAEAFFWYRKAAAQGSAMAQGNLGLCYANGSGVAKDEREAFKWMCKAAAQGYDQAQYNLGVFYENGVGVEKNASEALSWYQKAAGQGLAAAQNNLGTCYEHGKGVSKNPIMAVFWYRQAANQGFAIAQLNLGVCYLNGNGVTKDLNEAKRWLRMAAQQGDQDAINELNRINRYEMLR